MKRALLCVILIAAMVAAAGCSDRMIVTNSVWVGDEIEIVIGPARFTGMTSGTHSGVGGPGYSGYVYVEVTVNDSTILDIEVIDHGETVGFAREAFNRLIPAMLYAQTPDVDAVTGITMTSLALRFAVADALRSAGGQPLATEEAVAGALDLEPGVHAGYSPDGYYGYIYVEVTVDNTSILSIEVTQHEETELFFNMASGAILPAIVTRQSTDVDSVSGATYTSLALIAAVEDAMMAAGADLATLRAGPAPGAGGGFTAGTFVHDLPRFDGHLEVIFTDAEITAINAYLTADTTVANAVSDILIALTQAMIDGGAGQPFSSVTATTPEVEAGADDDQPGDQEPAAAGLFVPGTYTASAMGYFDYITFAVTFDANSITDIEVVEHSETAMFADMVWMFMIPEILHSQSADVDTITGATATSVALRSAVADTIEQATANGADAPAATPADDDDNGDDTGNDNGNDDAAADGAFTPGTFTASAVGYLGEITVAVTFDADSITDVEVLSHNETAMFADMVWMFMIPDILAAQSADVDTVTGATTTSVALRNAVADAIEQASN